MCLIVWCQELHPEYKFILVANRDEYFQRPTSSLNFWNDNSCILGGRDLVGQGTWLGVNKNGKLAAITNYRIPFKDLKETSVGGNIEEDKIRGKSTALSRGRLLSSYLSGAETSICFLEHLISESSLYNDFNLLVGNLAKEPLDIFYFGTKNETKEASQIQKATVCSLIYTKY
jgi:uncharacterized protein with NRDE domain